MERKGFVFYRSFFDAAQDLDPLQRLEFYDAVIQYGLDGVVDDSLSPVVKIMMKMAIPQIDINNEKYQSGTKGGRPSKKDLPCTKEEFLSIKTIPDEWEGIVFPKSWIKERCVRRR